MLRTMRFKRAVIDFFSVENRHIFFYFSITLYNYTYNYTYNMFIFLCTQKITVDKV